MFLNVNKHDEMVIKEVCPPFSHNTNSDDHEWRCQLVCQQLIAEANCFPCLKMIRQYLEISISTFYNDCWNKLFPLIENDSLISELGLGAM